MDERKEKMKKQSRIRLWFQAAWFVLTNGYMRGYAKGMIFTGGTKVLCVPGLNCYSCPGALGACPMGALQAVLGNVSYRVSLYVFGMIAAMGVVFGRLICGWMCPFGLFQDLLYRIKVKSKKKNLPGHKYLKYLRYVILIVFPILLVSVMLDVTGASMPWFCEWICPSGMLMGGIPLVLMNQGLRAAIGARFFWKLFILLAITLLAVFYYRPFCKYLCPLGALYGLFNPIASYRLVIDPEKCISCGTCQKTCGMDIKTFEDPNSPDCIRCGSCMAACPAGAIESTWGRTGQKIKSRCFIDDGAVLPARDQAESMPAKRNGRPLFLGILMLVAGASSMHSSIRYIVSPTLMGHYQIEQYRELNVLIAVMGAIWCITSVIVMLTGAYAIRFSNEPERLLSVNEKLKAAWRIALIGLVIGIIGTAAALPLIINFIEGLTLDTFVFMWIPVLMLQVKLMNSDIRKEKKSGVFWWILSLLNTVFALSSPWLVLLILRMMG